jgi:hypothetical protein
LQLCLAIGVDLLLALCLAIRVSLSRKPFALKMLNTANIYKQASEKQHIQYCYNDDTLGHSISRPTIGTNVFSKDVQQVKFPTHNNEVTSYSSVTCSTLFPSKYHNLSHNCTLTTSSPCMSLWWYGQNVSNTETPSHRGILGG